jgi:HEAT repeat protein
VVEVNSQPPRQDRTRAEDLRNSFLRMPEANSLPSPNNDTRKENESLGSAPEESKPFMVKRLDQLSAEDLRKQLLRVPEVNFLPPPGNDGRRAILEAAMASRPMGLAATELTPFAPFGPTPGPAARPGRIKRQAPTDPDTLLVKRRAELAGLPLLKEPDCRLGKEPAENLHVLSRRLRAYLQAALPADQIDRRPDPDRLRDLLLGNDPATTQTILPRSPLPSAGIPRSFPAPSGNGRLGWREPSAVPALLQLLQAENTPVRKVLVEVLGKISGEQASAALAMRAMVDLDLAVREAAVGELRSRPPEQYRSLLLTGLGYPWAPVAEHAAEALVALKDTGAVPHLLPLLDAPPPARFLPSDAPGKPAYTVRELVRINHLANCVLCHAPSHDRNDLVRGAVPLAGQPLPPPVAYYEQGQNFVRADITYLRQHFSVPQPVAAPGGWPAYQRFDYLVRVRRLTSQEQTRLNELTFEDNGERREIIRFALRELTGQDLRPSQSGWGKLLSVGRPPSGGLLAARGAAPPFPVASGPVGEQEALDP